MKCSRCGHDYPSTSARCTRCGHLVIHENSSGGKSQLIAFPLRARMPEKKQEKSQELPAWREELKAVVQARKAQQQATIDSAELPKNSAQTAVDSTSFGNGEAANKSPNPTLEAALLRARRANEKAMQSALGRIEPARRVEAVAMRTTDTTATALVREPEEAYFVEPDLQAEDRKQTAESRQENYTFSQPSERSELSKLKTQNIESILPTDGRNPEVKEGKETADFQTFRTNGRKGEAAEGKTLHATISPHIERKPQNSTLNPQPSTLKVVKCLDENCALDYLDAEVQKVERDSRRSAQKRQPELVMQIMILLTDGLVIGLSCAPFLALARLMLGSFALGWQVNLTIILMIAAFYLFMTQLLCGKTFGMMQTKTHIVEAGTNVPPSLARTGLRTIGFFVSLLAAGFGFFWMAIDRDGRSWIDIVSGTLVVRDQRNEKS